MFVVDRSGADERQILPPGTQKIMNPVCSSDGQWIYFTRGPEPQDETKMDVWRLPVSGGSPEPLTDQHLAGGILWASGDLIGLLFFVVLFVQWVRASTAEARREDRRLDLLEARERAASRRSPGHGDDTD